MDAASREKLDDLLRRIGAIRQENARLRDIAADLLIDIAIRRETLAPAGDTPLRHHNTS